MVGRLHEPPESRYKEVLGCEPPPRTISMDVDQIRYSASTYRERMHLHMRFNCPKWRPTRRVSTMSASVRFLRMVATIASSERQMDCCLHRSLANRVCRCPGGAATECTVRRPSAAICAQRTSSQEHWWHIANQSTVRRRLFKEWIVKHTLLAFMVRRGCAVERVYRKFGRADEKSVPADESRHVPFHHERRRMVDAGCRCSLPSGQTECDFDMAGRTDKSRSVLDE